MNTATIDFQPNCVNMKIRSQSHLSTTIKMGGEAKLVMAPPTEIFTKRSAKVMYFNDFDGLSTKNFSDKSMAQIVMAAGPVIKELKNADKSKIDNHHDSILPLNTFTIRHKMSSKSLRIGLDEAIIIITIIKIGSLYESVFKYCTKVCQL